MDVSNETDVFEEVRVLQDEMTTAESIYRLHEGLASVNAEQRRLFRSIIDCLERRANLHDDHDPTHWISIKLDISHWKARRWIACAYALDRLPYIDQAFQEGAISVDKLVELTRFATPETERELLGWSLDQSTAVVRARADLELRVSEPEMRNAERHRSLEWTWSDDNTRLFLSGDVPALEGAKITTALDRLADKIKVSPEDLGDADDPATTIEARRADALALLASQAIAEDADPDRATVVLHVYLDDDASVGSATLAGGRPLPRPLVERFLCDSRIQPVLHHRGGGVTGIGFTSRDIPPWLRRQVEHRDHYCCTFPGCGARAFLQPHHIVPWPLGPTDLDNLVMVCPAHHKLVHEFRWHVKLGKEGKVYWFRPSWTPYEPRPRPSPPEPQSDETPVEETPHVQALPLQLSGVF